MDVETQRQIAELDELRTAHRQRLRLLELQAARQGNSTAPETLTEIETIKARLVPIDAAIFKLTYIGTVRADTPDGDRGEPKVIRATERALERNRRATVAALMDNDLKQEARIAAALTEIRFALVAIASLAIASVVLSILALVLK